MAPSVADHILLSTSIAALTRASIDGTHREHDAARQLLSDTRSYNITRYRYGSRFGKKWIAEFLSATPRCARFLRPELRAALDPRVKEFVSHTVAVLKRSFGTEQREMYWPVPPTYFGRTPFRMHPIADGVDRLTLLTINFRSSLGQPPPFVLWAASEVRDGLHELIFEDIDFKPFAADLWSCIARLIPGPGLFQSWIRGPKKTPALRITVEKEEVHEIRDFMPHHLSPRLEELYKQIKKSR